METERRRREVLLNQNANKNKHHPSRQSAQTQSEHTQQTVHPLSSLNASDDDERLFRVRNSFSKEKTTYLLMRI